MQPRYNLLCRQFERELFPLSADEGLGVIAYNPIAGGLLSGKHRREAGPMPGTRFTHPTAGARYRERYWHERELETVDALRPLAAEAGMSMVQMAVAWVLENPVITSPIVGTFYRSPGPDKESYVKEGSQVTPDSVVCIVEAMKLMNEIEADASGTIKAVIAENGQPVEFGQPLFIIA